MSENEESGAAADATAETEADQQADERGASTDAEAETDPDPELVDRLADADPAEVAQEIETLRERAEAAESALEARETQVEELESKLKRKQADFQNFKKRMERKQEEEAARATEQLVERLLDVRDNLERALDQDEQIDIRPGVEKTLDSFDRVLDAEGVEAITPEPGSEVDPQRHEVLMRVDSDHPEGAVDELHRPGYEMGGKVIRPAQVTVSDGE